MKPAPFDYIRPASVAEASALLLSYPGAKLLAGGQTLGPLLNLRLSQPTVLVDITRIARLVHVEETADFVTLGACITHAAIEDGRVPDATRGLLKEVAGGIAYRAVRTRGTIGGSLAHADPAADWLSCLIALRADVLITGNLGERIEPLSDFVRGALETSLLHGEILEGIRIPKPQANSRFGYAKLCRKTGEFAEAIGVVALDPERHAARIVAGATSGRPIVIDRDAIDVATLTDKLKVRTWLHDAGFAGGTYETNLHVAAIQRAGLRAVAQ